MPRIERGKRRTGRATTSEVAREIAEREAELERQRKAAPDPKKVLRAAHELRAEAQAGKLKRLEQSVDRGRDFVDRAEERRRGAERALAEREAAATERLAEMFAGGQEAASVSDRTAPLRSSLAQAQGEERQARAALGKLESDLAAARQQLIRREHAVAICALEVLLDLAADEAADKCILHDRRLERREDLVRLDLLLTGTVRLPNGFAKCASMLILLRQ